MNLNIIVYRARASLKYQRDPAKGNDWHNNDANNSMDTFVLKNEDTGTVLFTCKVQSVANAEGLIAGVHQYDTLAPGPFALKAFVAQRAFACQPHGIVNALTLRGDHIDLDSVTADNLSRWLMHDWRGHDGKDTRVAWSAGCLVVADADLERFSAILRLQGINPGNIIPGIPQWVFKGRVSYALDNATRVGMAVQAQGPTYARGDDNNLDVNGMVPGYATVKIDINRSLGKSVNVYAGASNLFNASYSSFGMLGANNLTTGAPEQFRAVGAPRTLYAGVQVRF